MGFSRSGRGAGRWGVGIGGWTGLQARGRTRPACEALEARELLAAAISPGVLSPTAAVVNNAEAVISGGAATEFARYQADLQRAEQSSRVTPAAFANLKSDAASLAQAIDYAPLTSQAVDQQLVELQDVMDQAFLDASANGSAWNQVSQELGSALYGVTFTNTNLPNQAFTDMQTVAKEARVTPAERKRLVADEKAIDAALGPNVDTSLGGSVPRDPVVAYYDGQVAQFVHKR
jgi:hypothetical protein